jgi:RAD51-like protein 1
MFAADLDIYSTRLLVERLATRAAPRLKNAEELLLSRERARSFFPLGLPSVDGSLGGGLSRGTLTEVVGPAGAGKTQLCLMLAAMAGLPEGLGGLGEGTGVLYLDTERKFAAERLVEIAQNRAPEWYDSVSSRLDQGETQLEGTDLGGRRVVNMLRNTHVLAIDESVALMVCDR